jgi:hypothetical protein
MPEHDAAAGEWYWDRQVRKAYYVRETDENTVELVSVWHAEEFADALESEAIVPLAETGADRVDTAFASVDSFRTDTDLADSDPWEGSE